MHAAHTWRPKECCYHTESSAAMNSQRANRSKLLEERLKEGFMPACRSRVAIIMPCHKCCHEPLTSPSSIGYRYSYGLVIATLDLEEEMFGWETALAQRLRSHPRTASILEVPRRNRTKLHQAHMTNMYERVTEAPHVRYSALVVTVAPGTQGGYASLGRVRASLLQDWRAAWGAGQRGQTTQAGLRCKETYNQVAWARMLRVRPA